MDINVISDWLGHGDISTTSSYLHIDMSMKRKILQKFNWFERLMKDNNPMEKPDWKDMEQVSKLGRPKFYCKIFWEEWNLRKRFQHSKMGNISGG